MDHVQKSSNSYHALKRRELGLSGRRLPEALLARRVLSNMATGRYTDTVYKSSQRSIERLWVRYPCAISGGDETPIDENEDGPSEHIETIQLWNFETGKCRWTKRVANVFHCFCLELLEDRVVYTGLLTSMNEIGVWILQSDTGEKIAENLYPELTSYSHVVGKRRDLFIAEKNQIERLSLETGKVTQKLPSKPFIKTWELPGFYSRLVCSKDFLVHLYQGGLVVYNLERQRVYPINVDFKGKEVKSVALEGAHLLCVFGWGVLSEGGTSRGFNYYVFDLEKRTAASIYKNGSDDPSLEWQCDTRIQAVLDKEWVYLGYSSGHVVAVNWINHRWSVFGQLVPVQDGFQRYYPRGIDYMSLQEGILITGSKANVWPGLLVFWDIRTLKLIAEMEWPSSLCPPVWSFGKLIFAQDSFLVVRDFGRWMDDASS